MCSLAKRFQRYTRHIMNRHVNIVRVSAACGICLVITFACSGTALCADNAPQTDAVKAPVPVSAGSIVDTTLRRFAGDHDVKAAQDGLVAAVAAEPHMALPCYYLGLLAESEENWDDAAKWLEQFLSLEDPNSAKALQAKAELDCVKKFREMDATPEGKKARKYDVRMKRAQAFADAGMLKLAVSEASKASEIDADRWEAYALTASILASQKQYPEAVKFLKSAVDRAPETKKAELQKALNDCDLEDQYAVMMQSGAKSADSGDYAKASETLEKARALFPDREDAKLALASVYVLSGKYDTATELLLSLRASSNRDKAQRAREMTDRLALRRAGTIIVAQSGAGDYQTISAAVSNAKPNTLIYVRPGTYNEAVTINKPLAVVGDGPRDQIIIVANDDNCIYMNFNGFAETRNLTLHASGQKNYSALYTKCGALLVDSCDISSETECSAICISDTGSPLIRDCMIHGSKQNGVYIYNGGRGILERCDIYDNSNAGISVGKDAAPTIRECKIHDNKYSGISSYTRSKGVTDQCEIYGNHLGFCIFEGADPTVRYCKIHDNTGDGVFAYGVGVGTAEHCDIYGNSGDGISLSQKANPTVRDCKIHDGKSNGIYFGTGSTGIIERCEIYGNKSTGVYISGSSPALRECGIHDNNGGVLFYKGQGVLERCDIYANAKDGMWIDYANPTIRESKVHNNHNTGVNCFESEGILERCKIYDNVGEEVHVTEKSKLDIRDCDVAKDEPTANTSAANPPSGGNTK